MNDNVAKKQMLRNAQTILFVIIAVIAVILIIDFSNGGLGYVRY